MCRVIPTCALRVLAVVFGSFSVFAVICAFAIAAPHTSLKGSMSTTMREQVAKIGYAIAKPLLRSSSHQASTKGSEPSTLEEELRQSLSNWLMEETRSAEVGAFVTDHWRLLMGMMSSLLVVIAICGLSLVIGSCTNQTCFLCPWMVVTVLVDLVCVTLLASLVYLLVAADGDGTSSNTHKRDPWLEMLLKVLLCITPCLSLQIACVCALAKRLKQKQLKHMLQKLTKESSSGMKRQDPLHADHNTSQTWISS